MRIVSTPTVSTLERAEVCKAGHEESGGATKERDTALAEWTCGERWPRDALSNAGQQLATADTDGMTHAS
jgi:hypothetical protein